MPVSIFMEIPLTEKMNFKLMDVRQISNLLPFQAALIDIKNFTNKCNFSHLRTFLIKDTHLKWKTSKQWISK